MFSACPRKKGSLFVGLDVWVEELPSDLEVVFHFFFLRKRQELLLREAGYISLDYKKELWLNILECSTTIPSCNTWIVEGF